MNYHRLRHVTCDITTIHTHIATLLKSGIKTLNYVLQHEAEITRNQAEITRHQAEIT